jgi:hypothetical protein
MRREEGGRAQEGWKDTICDPYSFAHRASECSTFAMLISPYLQRTGVLNSISDKCGKSGCSLQSISATGFLPPCPCRDPALEPLNWKLKRRWCRAREREHAVPPPSQPFSLPPWLITRNNNEKEARSKTTNNSRECKGIGGNRGDDEAERLPQRRACKSLRHVDRYPCTLPPMCRSSSCRTHLHGRRRGWRPPQAPRRSPPCGTPYLSRPQSKKRGSQAVHDPSQRTHKVLVWSKRGKKTPDEQQPPLSVCRGTALAVICLTRQTDRQTDRSFITDPTPQNLCPDAIVGSQHQRVLSTRPEVTKIQCRCAHLLGKACGNALWPSRSRLSRAPRRSSGKTPAKK